MAVNRNKPSEEEVKKTIAKWAPMLRIADWQIEFEWLNSLEMQAVCEDDTSACCICNRELKNALIRINEENSDVKDDWWQVLAHELYHIVTDDFYYHVKCVLDMIPEDVRKIFSDQINIYYERLVDDLAKGFVATLRKEGG